MAGIFEMAASRRKGQTQEEDIQELLRRMKDLPPVPVPAPDMSQVWVSPENQEADIAALQARMADIEPRQGVERLPPTADYAKWADRLQKEPQPVQEVPGLTPERRRGMEAGGGAIAGTPTAEITGTLPEEPGAGGMSPDKRAMLLRVLSGLTTAGRRMTSTPTLAEIRHGAKITPEFRPETQLLGAAEQIEGEERVKKAEAEAKTKAEEEGKKSPLVAAARQMAEAVGLPPEVVNNIKTDDQAKTFFMATGQEEKIKLLQTQRGAIEGKTAAAVKQKELNQEQMKRVAAGDMTALPQDDKDRITKARKDWLGREDTKDYQEAYKAAKDVESLIASGTSTGHRVAITKMVKAAGDTGRLSDQDISRFQERMGIAGVYDKLANIIYSKLNPEQQREYIAVVKEMAARAIAEIEESADKEIASLQSLYPHYPKEGLQKYMLGYTPGKKEKTVDLINVTNPKDIAWDVPMTTAQDFINSGQYRVIGD